MEFDPSEPSIPAIPSPSQSPGPHSAPADFSFETIKGPLRIVVAGILKSEKIWTSHKFVGNPQLDLKLKGWMNSKIDPELVEAYWAAFRRGVKEVFHYKRVRTIDNIKKAFFGTLAGQFVVVVLFLVGY